MVMNLEKLEDTLNPFEYIKEIMKDWPFASSYKWIKRKYKGGSEWFLEIKLDYRGYLEDCIQVIDAYFLNRCLHKIITNECFVLRIKPEEWGYMKARNFCDHMGFSSANLSNVKYKYISVSASNNVNFYLPPIEIDLTPYRDISGFAGLYKVSPDGNVYSCNKRKLLTPLITIRGYARVGLYKDKKYHYNLIHRLVAMEFISNQEKKGEVNHKNGIKTDNRVENLEWVTRSENMIHGYKNGLIKVSEKCISILVNNNKTRDYSKRKKRRNNSFQ